MKGNACGIPVRPATGASSIVWSATAFLKQYMMMFVKNRLGGGTKQGEHMAWQCMGQVTIPVPTTKTILVKYQRCL